MFYFPNNSFHIFIQIVVSFFSIIKIAFMIFHTNRNKDTKKLLEQLGYYMLQQMEIKYKLI